MYEIPREDMNRELSDVVVKVYIYLYGERQRSGKGETEKGREGEWKTIFKIILREMSTNRNGSKRTLGMTGEVHTRNYGAQKGKNVSEYWF